MKDGLWTGGQSKITQDLRNDDENATATTHVLQAKEKKKIYTEGGGGKGVERGIREKDSDFKENEAAGGLASIRGGKVTGRKKK